MIVSFLWLFSYFFVELFRTHFIPAVMAVGVLLRLELSLVYFYEASHFGITELFLHNLPKNTYSLINVFYTTVKWDKWQWQRS